MKTSMKNFSIISGVIFVNLFVFGALFKLLHFPGAHILIVLGMGLFCLVFLPVAFYQSYIDNLRSNKLLYFVGFICAFIVIAGALFKIMHWPGAGILLLLGLPLPFLVFLPLYIYRHLRAKDTSVVNFLGVMFMMVYVALFSSLLALNVHRNFSENFADVFSGFYEINELVSEYNEDMYKRWEYSEDAAKKEKIRLLKMETNSTTALLYDTRQALTEIVIDSDDNTMTNRNIIEIFKLNGREAEVRKTMWGVEGISGKALLLKEKMNNYSSFLSATFPEMDIENINFLLSTSGFEAWTHENPVHVSWENAYFPQTSPLIVAWAHLYSLEIAVRMAEMESLDFMFGAD